MIGVQSGLIEINMYLSLFIPPPPKKNRIHKTLANILAFNLVPRALSFPSDPWGERGQGEGKGEKGGGELLVWLTCIWTFF